MLETKQAIANQSYFRMQLSLETLQTPNPRQEESCAFSEANRLSQWSCNEQTAVSHCSTEADTISLDAGLRMEVIAAFSLWDTVIDVLVPQARRHPQQCFKQSIPQKQVGHKSLCGDFDFVTPNAQISSIRASLSLCFRRQRSCNQTDPWQEPQHETRFQKQQS